jgi:prepilin-type N-terminal cleavage/methylation domain-containing protein/prepilin-type processing-associated H-X9-DG protein
MPSKIRRSSAFSLLELLVALSIIAILIALTAAGVQKVRGAAARAVCLDRLRQLSIGMQHVHSQNGRLPAGTTSPDDAKLPFVTWHSRLLPMLEREALWRQVTEAYAADKDFLTPPHEAVRSQVVLPFVCPADHFAQGKFESPTRNHALTSFLGVNGLRATRNDGMLFLDSKIRLSDVTDGTSQTIMIGERSPGGVKGALGWWYAGWGTERNGEADAHLGVRVNVTGSYGAGCSTPAHFQSRKIIDPCTPFQFGSVHPGGAHFAFADGSARFLSYSVDPYLPALATRAGGESFTLPE